MFVHIRRRSLPSSNDYTREELINVGKQADNYTLNFFQQRKLFALYRLVYMYFVLKEFK